MGITHTQATKPGCLAGDHALSMAGVGWKVTISTLLDCPCCASSSTHGHADQVQVLVGLHPRVIRANEICTVLSSLSCLVATIVSTVP